MGGTEEIYTVHVKTRPDPSQKYPSERAYSSSTAGGLAVIHLFLSGLGVALSCAILSNTGDLVGGATLVTGSLLSGITGMFAWKRWYVDRYVRWFFAASLVSIVAAVFTISLTIYCLVCPSLQTVYFLRLGPIRVRESNGTEPSRQPLDENEDVPVLKELHIHMILTAIMEFLVSAVSIKIAWKGVKNSYQKRPILPVRTEGVGGNEPHRPDILPNHKDTENKVTNYTNVMKELYRLQKSSVLAKDVVGNKIIKKFYVVGQGENGLPLPESRKEYQERMEKFLASNHDGKEA
ncbi:uncharacterized protein LOC106664439 [Cimex lectularius]|uniref:Uncharacterized protein n=1 Tax=Cimex lectularius TaxID=79782 RepID=A0A8I6RHM6_CIMLE|nr:uncharacterized protein LOC106664439 [Cimex lectularius]